MRLVPPHFAQGEALDFAYHLLDPEHEQRIRSGHRLVDTESLDTRLFHEHVRTEYGAHGGDGGRRLHLPDHIADPHRYCVIASSKGGLHI